MQETLFDENSSLNKGKSMLGNKCKGSHHTNSTRQISDAQFVSPHLYLETFIYRVSCIFYLAVTVSLDVWISTFIEFPVSVIISNIYILVLAIQA